MSKFRYYVPEHGETEADSGPSSSNAVLVQQASVDVAEDAWVNRGFHLEPNRFPLKVCLETDSAHWGPYSISLRCEPVFEVENT